MTETLSEAEAGKFASSMAAVALVEDGMKLGLGTGSTANWMVRCVAKRVADEGLSLTCVPTSSRTADLARALGLNVVSLDEAGTLDLTIDGADEFDPALNLIKGGGGAHLQEKIVAAASTRMVVITDASKDVAKLGAFPLPIEVVPFGMTSSKAQIEKVIADADVDGRETSWRMAGDDLFVSDENNHILDLHLGRIGDAAALSAALLAIPGVVETGLFLGLCDRVVIGHGDGRTETRMADGSPSQYQVADLALAATLPTPG